MSDDDLIKFIVETDAAHARGDFPTRIDAWMDALQKRDAAAESRLAVAEGLLQRWNTPGLFTMRATGIDLSLETAAFLAPSSGTQPPGSVPAREASEDAKDSAGARATPEPTQGTCKDWCGTQESPVLGDVWWSLLGSFDPTGYCAPACRDAGKALNPKAPL